MARLALDHFVDKLFQNLPKNANIFLKLMWEGSVWILMDPYGPVWVRMVPGDSLGASWGLLGPWGDLKGG